MGENTKIEWAHHTFNPVIGCAKVSDGCKFCYAEEMMDKRYGRVKWGINGTRSRTSMDNWRKPYAWDRKAKKLGSRQRVFCASLSDIFEDHPDWVEPRRDLLRVISKTPNLDWLLLTKRPENILRMIEESAERLFKFGDTAIAVKWLTWLKHGIDYALPNVWIGTSVENQEQADKRIPELLEVPATVRFLSMEPLLGDVDIWDNLIPSFASDDPRHFPKRNGIEWVIVGGESGTNARPMHPDWVRSIRDQCVATRTPYLLKQWGEWIGGYHDLPDELQGRVNDGVGNFDMTTMDDGLPMYKFGKHNTGRLLDGIEWNQFPEAVKS